MTLDDSSQCSSESRRARSPDTNHKHTRVQVCPFWVRVSSPITPPSGSTSSPTHARVATRHRCYADGSPSTERLTAYLAQNPAALRRPSARSRQIPESFPVRYAFQGGTLAGNLLKCYGYGVHNMGFSWDGSLANDSHIGCDPFPTSSLTGADSVTAHYSVDTFRARENGCPNSGGACWCPTGRSRSQTARAPSSARPP